MKKTLLFTLVCLAFFNKSKAQYHPMLADTSRWCLVWNFFPIRADEMRFFEFQQINSFGDTLIDSIFYKPVLTDLGAYYGAWREDTATQKVYFIKDGATSEELIYDFSLNLGDNITLDFHNNASGFLLDGIYTVDSVNYVTIRGGLRKYMRLHNLSNPNNPATGTPLKLEWIESVGEIHSPVYNYMDDTPGYGPITSMCNNNFGTSVIKQLHGNTKNYVDICAVSALSTTAVVSSDTCSVSYSGGIALFDDLNNINVIVFPNPSNNSKLHLVANTSLNGNVALKVNDTNGKLVYETSTKAYNGIIDVDGLNLNNGIYSLSIVQEGILKGRSKLIIEK